MDLWAPTAVRLTEMLFTPGCTSVIIRGHTLSQKMTSATVLAQNKLESIYATTYTDLSTTSEVITTDNRQQYICTAEVEEDTPAAGMKTVSITVRWAKSDILNHQVRLKTIVFEN